MSRESVTIYSVADACGVSPRTVSRYLNHPEKLAEKTRKEIAAIIHKIGYRPSVYANRVSCGKQNVLAVLTSVNAQQPISPLHRLLLGYISCKLCAVGKDLLLIGVDQENEERIIRESIHRNKFDSLLMLTPLSPELLEELAHTPFPKVSLNWIPHPPMAEHAYVGIDMAASSRQFTQALLNRGYRRLAYIEPPLGNTLSDRGAAALETVKNSRGDAQITSLCFSGETPSQAARKLTAEILSCAIRPEILYCYSDLVAINMMTAIQSFGVKIPEEIAIAGFDGEEAATWMTPNLTTVAQPWMEMAERAVMLLLDWNSERDSGQTHHLDTEILWRGSTGFSPA